MTSRNILVVGGGFAGIAAVQALEKSIPDGWRVILISEENYITYTPLLPEVVGGSLLPGHAVAPLRRMLKGAELIRGRVTGIDTGQRRLHYRIHQDCSLDYAQLVLACGTLANLDFVPGLFEYGLPLKTLGDALYLRNRMVERLEQAEVEEDAALRRRLTRFVVVGGGSSGVEVAGAMRDFLVAAARQYPSLSGDDLEVLVVEGGERLVSEFPPSLGAFALKAMQRHGIEVRLGCRIARVMADGVEDQDGKRIEAANVVCTIGTEPSPLIARLALPKIKGCIRTLDDMSVAEAEGLWAIGDCAAIHNQATGEACPPTAQFALRQGQQVGRNILRRLAQQPTRPFAYRPRGNLASIGHHRAVAIVYGWRLSGFSAWLLWRAFYLLKLPTLLRKVQVFLEWSVAMLFPQDVTQLHLVRTQARREERNG